ncbi:hypothetical protein VB711_02685 [Cronbergia sp. UHCC 0137]|uniref:hypothetical protein n=1 Tax=Cronbergia sp. UHCC 0137 TaxID=3110239 RepID=UPI002B20E68B|nr:hypothetical protein [Cronbergia sp. UHCC 0137]MEA5616749.1 hypothetical protein [Cronbergia sp. UHCC 0137]
MLKHNLKNYHKPLLTLLSITAFFALPILPSSAKNIPQPSDAPLELNLLKKSKPSVITSNTINPDGLTVPSLWWAKENSEKKLLDNWIAYPASPKESARLDLIVNQQIWSLLDYLERYNFLNYLGSISRQSGYNVRVFNYQEELLATYTCNFIKSPTLCTIKMNFENKLGVIRPS